MGPILEWVRDQELRHIDTGQPLIEQGGQSQCLYVLVEGRVEVVRDEVRVATASEPGAVFGEMAALLGGPHTATVRALAPCAFRVVPEPAAFLKRSPEFCLHVCELLARRLDALNGYLVDVRDQFRGHDHLDLVDGVLEALMNRQPRPRVRPRDSTVHHGEIAD